MESFRFKVVKIISKEPFKRGRWLCMDFTDPPSNGTANIEDCLAHNHPDITSSAGQVSAVAIDNKIEQAMDLVKSHLMFAVREEMDVLKEKICDLTEKNNRLERENQILRAAATPETLQLVEQFHQQIQPTQSSPSNAQLTSQAQITSLPLTTSQQTITTTSPQSTQQTNAPPPQITQQITTSAISTINSTINTPQPLNHQQINQQQINNQQQLAQQQAQINQQSQISQQQQIITQQQQQSAN